MLWGLLIIVVGMGSAAGWPARADSGCYPAAGIEVFELTMIRERYWMLIADSNNRWANPGEIFAVKASTTFEDACWIQIAEGWIRSNSVVPTLPPDPETATPASTGTNTRKREQPACFGEEYVYLSGQMNVRKSHNINSGLVGHTNAGDVFEITDTFRGATYCWLRIDDGWIARLGVVQSLDSIGLPIIEGGDPFIGEIRSALDYLREREPKWFMYVVTNTRSIGRSPYQNKSTANGRRKHTQIASQHLSSSIWLASVLVHEACHMVQWDRGDRMPHGDYKDKIRREKECLRIQREMVWDINRSNPLAAMLTEMLSWSDSEWLTNMG